MRLRTLLTGILVLGLVSLSSAQFRNTSPVGNPSEYLRNQNRVGLSTLRGLFDPARMQMSHSMSFGYATMGGQSASQGLYMNRLDYQISRPLSITTHLGYRFQPSGPAEWNPAGTQDNFVGGADLNWRPTDNSLFRVSVYRNMNPNPYYGNYGWGAYDYRPYLVRP